VNERVKIAEKNRLTANLHCVKIRIASHRIASHRIASHRIASHRIASHRIASHRIASHRIASHRIASLANTMPAYFCRAIFVGKKYKDKTFNSRN